MTSVLQTIIGAIGVCAALKQRRVFVECIPSGIAHVVWAGEHLPYVGNPADDAYECETLYDTIVRAQAIGARLMGYVEPQNLLFIFSETTQALVDFPLYIGPDAEVLRLADQPTSHLREQQAYTKDQRHAKDRAVVHCQVIDAKRLEQLDWRKQYKSRNEGQCFEVTWGELEYLKRLLEKVKGHTEIVSQGGAA
jgi:hypothetical protein